MIKRLAIATAIVVCASSSFATTTIGGATLIDTAVVHSGTVTTPTTYLTYVSGGNGLTGTADGATFTLGGYTPAAAVATADHAWLQFDAPILMFSSFALNSVLAVPAIDHDWTSGNTTEFWEPFEFVIKGCTSASITSCSEVGVITDVYTRGVDDTGTGRNADDWSTRWGFSQAYNYFGVFSGDRLVGGCYSCGEGEIDALASGAFPVPEPASLPLLLGALVLLGLVLRRRAA